MLRIYDEYKGKMFCFSPPVMLATFLIEFILAFYTLWRYKRTPVSMLVFVLLICLGIFQVAEFMICGGFGIEGAQWARIGYVSITLLPALGVHLILELAKQKALPLLVVAYGSALAFAGFFALGANSVIADTCTSNYAVFDLSNTNLVLYSLFYYGWLFVAVGLATYFARRMPKKAPVLRWMAIGYSVFIIPTATVNLIDPRTTEAIPSIMCGFAVLLAIVLVGKVLPLSGTPLAKRKKH